MKFNKTSQEYRQLNDFVRGEMKRQKISQDDVAYSLNLSQASISQKLSGKTEWTLWEMFNVFELLGVYFDYRNKDQELHRCKTALHAQNTHAGTRHQSQCCSA